MNLGQLGQTLAANKPALLGVAAAGVVGLGLYHRKQGGGVAAPPSAAPAGYAFSSGGQTAPMTGGGLATGGGVYDSSASDVASWLAPQLEALRQQQAPVPVPAPPAWAPGFYRNAAGKGIYQVDAKGNRDLLSSQEWGLMGQGQSPVPIARDSSFWTETKKVG